MFSRIWHIIVLVLHRYYPPPIFVFYPLYKLLRRGLHLPMAFSNCGVYLISAALHGALLGLFAGETPGIICVVIFGFLAIVSTAVIVASKPRYRRRKQCASGDHRGSVNAAARRD